MKTIIFIYLGCHFPQIKSLTLLRKAFIKPLSCFCLGAIEQLEKLPWPTFGAPFIHLSSPADYHDRRSSLTNPLSKPKPPNPVIFRVGVSHLLEDKKVLDYAQWDPRSEKLKVSQKPMPTQLAEIRPHGVLIVVPDEIVCSWCGNKFDNQSKGYPAGR